MQILLVALVFTAGMARVTGNPAPNQHLKDYLYQYGYLPASDLEKGVLRTESELEQATMRLQKFMGLEMTGKLDGPTMELMGKPRCGMADMRVKDDGQGIVEVSPPMNYTLSGKRWSKKRAVTYGFINFTPDLPQNTVFSVFESAAGMWSSESSGLKCRKAEEGEKVKIRISFSTSTGEHDCPYPFNGVLAHAFNPPNGDVHVNDVYQYSASPDPGYRLLWVAIHELGHSFGIYHSELDDAVMWPYYNGRFSLHSDDIAAIQAIYGA